MTPEQELADIEAKIENLTRQKRELETRTDAARAQQYIALTGMTKDQVQLSSGPGVPWHNHLSRFAEWLKLQPKPRKRWCEWNTRIYSTAELIDGVFAPTPVNLTHLQP